MATTSRRENTPLIERLKERSFEFQFAQAVRVLERIAGSGASNGAAKPAGVEGATHDHGRSSLKRQYGVELGADPGAEIVRFRVHQSLSFPAAEIASLVERSLPVEPPSGGNRAHHVEPKVDLNGGSGAQPVNDPVAEKPNAYDMSVTFFGLTGPSGVLPFHYTTMLLRQIRNRNEAMRDFLDLYNHRLISMFYRAIEKHHFPLAFERTRHNGQVGADVLTQILFALIGMGADDLRGRMNVRDENLLYFAGHFSRSPRSAVALERIISEYFRVECRVIQFQGQWLRLSPSDQSAMPTARNPEGRNAQLGVSTVIGSEVWDVQSRFRVQLGPLDLERFIEFTPARPLLRELCELIRLYVGMEYDFDIQPILRREDVPMSVMGGEAGTGAYLGWTSWLQTDAATEDFSGAVFSLDDV